VRRAEPAATLPDGVALRHAEPADRVAALRVIEGALLEVDAAAVAAAIDADVVVSDMAPDMTGEYDLDHARSVHLARQAYAVASDLLAPGGDFAVKVFQGRDLDDLREEIAADFEYVRTVSPPASRDSSSEVYLVAKGRVTAPIAEGDRLEVEITDTGDEGDGVASVDGYTLFVPGAEPGETAAVVVDDLKPTFGFAERVD